MTDTTTAHDLVRVLGDDRALAIVRAPRIPDVEALSSALVRGGIRTLELTYTTPGLPDLLRRATEAAEETGAIVGAGTVLDIEQARTATGAGARFLVTPGQGGDAAEIVRVAHDAGAAAMIGAMTPSEVMRALEIGADVVKIFPARTVGPKHFSDLRGPLPDAPLVPSGGVDADNAADYLRAGALAVTAGTSVVAPQDVSEGRWGDIQSAAEVFRDALP